MFDANSMEEFKTKSEIYELAKSERIFPYRRERWNSNSYQRRALRRLREKYPELRARPTGEVPMAQPTNRKSRIYKAAKSVGFLKPKGAAWNSAETIRRASEWSELAEFLSKPVEKRVSRKFETFKDMNTLNAIMQLLEKRNMNNITLVGFDGRSEQSSLVTPSERFINNVKEKLTQGGFLNDFNVTGGGPPDDKGKGAILGSDDETIAYWEDNTNKLLVQQFPSKKQIQGGSFFKHYLNPKYTGKGVEEILKRCGIMTREEHLIHQARGGSGECLGNCIIELEKCGKIKQGTHELYLSWKIDNRNSRTKTNILGRSISKKIGCGFLVTTVKHSDNRPGQLTVGFYGHLKREEYAENEIINIALYDDHYFIMEDTQYTKAAVKNFRYFDHKNWVNMYQAKTRNGRVFVEKTPPSAKRPKATTLDLVRWGLEQDLFIKMSYDDLNSIQEISKGFTSSAINDLTDRITADGYKQPDLDLGEHESMLEYVPPDPPLGYIKETMIPVEYKVIYFDIEASPTNTHIPFILRSIAGNEEECKEYLGEDCVEQFIHDLEPTPTLLLAHNLGYDLSFFFRTGLIWWSDIIRPSSSSIKTATGYIGPQGNRTRLVFKCTYSLTGIPLSEFASTFGLEVKKEIMPYRSYTPRTIKRKTMSFKAFCNGLDDMSQKRDLYKNCEDLGFLVPPLEGPKTRVNHIKYASWYCAQDCRVLKAGITKLRKEFKELFDLDLFLFVSIPHFSHHAGQKAGVFRGVHKLVGVEREFIRRCIYGGRVMTRDNAQQHIKGKNIGDFDAVSLYPSAMVRDDMDVPLGPPLRISNASSMKLQDLKKYNSAYLRVDIKRIPVPRGFPLLCKHNEELGVYNYENTAVGIHFLTKVQLEDVIEFHGLQEDDYEIQCGLFYNKGSNTELREFMRNTFEQRLKYKDKSSPHYNPVKQKLMKDVMNCFYGKCIQKPIDDQIKFFDNQEKRDNYCRRHYNNLIDVTDLQGRDGEWKLSVVKTSKHISNHAMYCHVGANILSVSKRVMNEVMCLAEDKGIDIYYQDTDSMHIDDDKLPILAEEFKQRYGRELVGKGMGQFHNDFSFTGAKYSVELLALGKKTYIDIVECSDEKGNIKYEEHYRFKGIPKLAIIEKAKELDIPILELYKNLKYGSDTLEYNWNCKRCMSSKKECHECKPGYNFKMNAGNKPRFECSKDFIYKTLDDQYRHVAF